MKQKVRIQQPSCSVLSDMCLYCSHSLETLLCCSASCHLPFSHKLTSWNTYPEFLMRHTHTHTPCSLRSFPSWSSQSTYSYTANRYKLIFQSHFVIKATCQHHHIKEFPIKHTSTFVWEVWVFSQTSHASYRLRKYYPLQEPPLW